MFAFLATVWQGFLGHNHKMLQNLPKVYALQAQLTVPSLASSSSSNLVKNCDNSAVDLKYYEIYRPRCVLEFFLKVIILNIEKIACEGCFITRNREQSTSEETDGSLELPLPGVRHCLEQTHLGADTPWSQLNLLRGEEAGARSARTNPFTA